MPEFSQPASFVTVRADLPDIRLPLSISDMTAILKEHLEGFLEHPEAFSGLPHLQSQSLFSDMPVFLEPSLLASTGRTSWALILPATIQQNPLTEGSEVGLWVNNSKAPGKVKDSVFTTAVGNLRTSATPVLHREISLALSARSIPAAFRAADAVYCWLIAMVPVFKLEFACIGVTVQPVRPATEQERAMFAPVAGNPVMTGISVVSKASFSYGAPDPV